MRQCRDTAMRKLLLQRLLFLVMRLALGSQSLRLAVCVGNKKRDAAAADERGEPGDTMRQDVDEGCYECTDEGDGDEQLKYNHNAWAPSISRRHR
ncbi:hypothetical protein WJ97_11385 [Burkholderia ubonensis]|nr:hypothetical protein WJ97_11385 [Burkholderia ubonensis]